MATPVKVGITFSFQQSCLEGCNIPETAESQGAASETEQAADLRGCKLQHPHRLATEHAPKTYLGWIPSANPKLSWTGCTYCKIPTEALAELRGETVRVCVGPSGSAKGSLDPFLVWSIPVSLWLMFSRCFVLQPHVAGPAAESCSVTPGREEEGDFTLLYVWHLLHLKHI